MPIEEPAYRLQQLALSFLEKKQIVPTGTTELLADDTNHSSSGIDPTNHQSYITEADLICDGKIQLFGTKRVSIDSHPNWNKDPLTGVVAPNTFWTSIDVTNQSVVGDIKYLWELNRHLHLVRLAQAFRITNNEKYLITIGHHIGSWIDQCKINHGPNWTSSLELAIRLINWSIVWNILGSGRAILFKKFSDPSLKDRWLKSIFAHCQHISRHLSRHSSANNHLLGELAGLYIGVTTWPCFQAAKRWQEFSKAELEAEAYNQHTTDGVNREQATAYQLFTMQFLAIAGLAGERYGDPFSPEYWSIVAKSVCFIDAISSSYGYVPQIGDSDDGKVFSLNPTNSTDNLELYRTIKSCLEQPNEFSYPPEIWWIAPEKPPLKNFLPKLNKTIETLFDFNEGGYHVFGSHFGTPREIKAIFDTGPTGYLGIAAHGHADSLSLILSVAGKPFLVDSGTYSYWDAISWRNYFRGTSAHNTIRVDGRDQSISGGRFMWLKKASCKVHHWNRTASSYEINASHDGYKKLPDPVSHTRNIYYRAEESELVVEDLVVGKKDHLAELYWHFAPELAVTLETPNDVRIEGSGFCATISITPNQALELALHRGQNTPPLGWYSRNYGEKVPTTTLRVTSTGSKIHLTTRFIFSFEDAK